jgi:hypothetical protein
MTKPTYTYKQRYADLLAQHNSSLITAHQNMHKAGDTSLMASAVIVTLHALGGREICPPFAIPDGLSNEAIAELRKCIETAIQISMARIPTKLKEKANV